MEIGLGPAEFLGDFSLGPKLVRLSRTYYYVCNASRTRDKIRKVKTAIVIRELHYKTMYVYILLSCNARALLTVSTLSGRSDSAQTRVQGGGGGAERKKLKKKKTDATGSVPGPCGGRDPARTG